MIYIIYDIYNICIILLRQGPVLSPEMTKQAPIIPPTNMYRNPVKLNPGG